MDLSRAKSETLDNIYSLIKWNIKSRNVKVDVTRNDLQVGFSAQHSVTMLKQSCSHSEPCRNNAVMLCCLTVLTLLVVVDFWEYAEKRFAIVLESTPPRFSLVVLANFKGRAKIASIVIKVYVLDFFRKKILGTTNVVRLSPTFTLLASDPKRHTFQDTDE